MKREDTITDEKHKDRTSKIVSKDKISKKRQRMDGRRDTDEKERR